MAFVKGVKQRPAHVRLLSCPSSAWVRPVGVPGPGLRTSPASDALSSTSGLACLRQEQSSYCVCSN